MIGLWVNSKKELLEHISVHDRSLAKIPVDIICTILSPDQADCDHLKLVSATAKHLTNGAVC